MCKLSIIIPVYNVEEYLGECLDSVLNNDYSDIEVICINDCSTDKSGEILQSYSERDERIRIFENDVNRGQGFSRNLGTEHALGEYIWYVDGDDIIEENIVNSLMKEVMSSLPDIFIFDAKVFKDEKNRKVNISELTYGVEQNYCMNGRDFFLDVANKGAWESTVWRRIYKKKFLINNQLSFRDGIIFEDILHSLRTILEAEKVLYKSMVAYYYRKRRGSTTTTADNNTYVINSLCLVLSEIENILNLEEDRDLRTAIVKIEGRYLSYLVDKIRHMDSVDREKLSLDERLHKYLYFGMAGCYKGYFPVLLDPKIMTAIRSAENIIIYGSGEVGCAVYDLLSERGIKVSCFIDSCNLEIREKRDTSIYNIGDVPYSHNNALVLIMAKNGRTQSEMKRNALQVGFLEKNIYTYDEVSSICPA